MSSSSTRLLIDGLARFIVVNPVCLAPVMLAITEGDPPAVRQRIVLTATITASIRPVLVALFGDRLLELLHIGVPALPVAAGIILFAIGFEMLRVRPTRMKSAEEEVAVARDSQQVGVSPLGIPMLAEARLPAIVGPSPLATLAAWAWSVSCRARARGGSWPDYGKYLCLLRLRPCRWL